MRRIVRSSISIVIIAIFCSPVMELNAVGKKKPTRRRARPKATKTAPIVLPAVLPTLVATPSSTVNTKLAPVPVKVKTVNPKAPTLNATATAGQLLISEFRFSGPGKPGVAGSGDEDEFIEIYNNSGADHTVAAASGSGYALVASDGVVRCSIANGELIKNKDHYLCANQDGYSLTGYPESDPVAQNNTYNTDIPENSGIALFNNNTGNYTTLTRIDAVGSTSAPALYREGAGYTPLTIFNLDYSFVRDMCGKSGNTSNLAGCTTNGVPKDTDNNAVDFFFIDTTGTNAGAGARLGAPGPQALFTPVERNATVSITLLDTCVSKDTPPNRVRNLVPDVANNSTFGTLDIRRTVTNNGAISVSKLRFRIVDMTTMPSSAGVADLRARDSTDVMVTVDRPPCDGSTSSVTVYGATLQNRFLFMGPPYQPLGGGINSLLAVGQINLFNQLAPGASIDVHFLLGVQQTGTYRFYVNVELFP